MLLLDLLVKNRALEHHNIIVTSLKSSLLCTVQDRQSCENIVGIKYHAYFLIWMLLAVDLISFIL